MPDFDVNLGRWERKIQKKSKKINKNLNDLKLIFLELVHLGLRSGKVWENRFFLYCMTLVDPYSKLLLRPGIQTSFTLMIFFVLTWWIINEFEKAISEVKETDTKSNRSLLYQAGLYF